MATTTRARFLEGPNLWHPRSGLLLELAAGSVQPEALRAPLAAADALLDTCRLRPDKSSINAGEGGALQIFIPCEEAGSGAAAWRLAQGTAPQAEAGLGAAALDSDSLAMVRATAARGIPHHRLAEGLGFVQLGQGSQARRILGSMIDTESAVARALSRSWDKAAALLRDHGVPAAGPLVCDTLENALVAVKALGYPVMLSAAGRRQAEQGHKLVADEDQLRAAYSTLASQGHVLAHPRLPSQAFQLLVVDGRLVAAIRNGPAARADLTAAVHPGQARVAERAAGVLGLKVAAIDLRTSDLSASVQSSPPIVAAVHAAPALAPFLRAAPARDVAGPIVSLLFPPGATGRVPTAGITGSLGKTTTCVLVAAMLAASGKTVARATTQGAWIGDEQVKAGDLAGGGTALDLLTDPSVEAGVFELARGGLLKRGLRLDGVDVGAVTNIFDHHVGIDGIRTREDLARVKRLVVAHARVAAILNADDPLCMGMREHVTAPRIGLVSLDPANPALAAHRATGGLVAWHEDGVLRLWRGATPIGELPAAELPTTWQGRFRPALWHALFAMAIATELGVPWERIAGTLRSFDSTPQANPGRMNLYRHRPYDLLVNYATGPEGMAELAALVRGIEVEGEKILLFSLAGNQPDDYIRQVGRNAAGAFSRYVCSDWYKLRGRQPRAVAGLLAAGLHEAGVPANCITVADSLAHGVHTAYGSVQPGDLLVENTHTYEGEPGWREMRGMAGKG